jgi:outer membrane protein
MSVPGKSHPLKYFPVLSLFFLIFHADAYADTDTAIQHHLHLGLGIGGQYLPHYRGSRETHTKVLPVPLIEYKGRIFKSDRDGTRAEFALSERIELSVSADLALNDGAEDNPLREGMPELESEFQFGPSINIDLTGDGFSRGWLLRLPVRPAMTVGDDIGYIGYTFNPMFTFIKPDLFNKWRVSMDLGLLYASEDYHQHYYRVAPEYVRATRPAYEAKAGFSGSFSEISIGSRKGNLFYGFSLRYDNLREAVFYKSPLVETENSFGVGWLLKSWKWEEAI